MTIEELTRLAMREAQDFRNKMLVTGQPYATHEEHYVFTRSIVRALRDEFVTAAVSGVALAAHVNAGTAKPGAVERIADSVINEILGSDAGERVTIKDTAVGAVLRLEAGDPPVPATDAAPAHEWFQFSNLVACRACGVVRRADDKNSPCKGPVRVALRDTDAAPAVCEWQRAGFNWDKRWPQCDPTSGPMFVTYRASIPQKCPLCFRPIKFTEAK